MNDNEQLRYQRAKEKVGEIRGFYTHALVFALVMAGLAYVNYATTPEFYWVVFPLLGWGIGLLAHAMRTFNLFPFFGKKWEERKIREYMDKDNFN